MGLWEGRGRGVKRPSLLPSVRRGMGDGETWVRMGRDGSVGDVCGRGGGKGEERKEIGR